MSASNPSPNQVIVDTNAIVDYLSNVEAVDRLFDSFDQLHVPMVVLGELYHGAFASGNTASELARIEGVRAIVSPMSCDLITAKTYGRLKAELRRKGQPIPDNELWIASLAVRHGFKILTRDTHFERIEECVTISW